jgi:hypothetical protein
MVCVIQVLVDVFQSDIVVLQVVDHDILDGHGSVSALGVVQMLFTSLHELAGLYDDWLDVPMRKMIFFEGFIDCIELVGLASLLLTQALALDNSHHVLEISLDNLQLLNFF